MSAFTAADTLHRLVKQALDSGEAVSIAEAEALFAGYRLALRLDDAQARDPHQQAVLLTSVALARRVFLGGVAVAAPADLPLLTPLPFGRHLGRSRRCARGHASLSSRRRSPRRYRRRCAGAPRQFPYPDALRGLARRDSPRACRRIACAGSCHGARADARRRARGQRSVLVRLRPDRGCGAQVGGPVPVGPITALATGSARKPASLS